jgi:hypothetical protein
MTVIYAPRHKSQFFGVALILTIYLLHYRTAMLHIIARRVSLLIILQTEEGLDAQLHTRLFSSTACFIDDYAWLSIVLVFFCLA